MKGNLLLAGFLSFIMGIAALTCTGTVTALAPESTFGMIGSMLCSDDAEFVFTRSHTSSHHPGQFKPSAACVQGDVREDVTSQAMGLLLGGSVICPAAAVFLPILLVLTVLRRRKTDSATSQPAAQVLSKQHSGSTVSRQQSITFNGQEYDNVEDLPPEVRANLAKIEHLLPQGFMSEVSSGQTTQASGTIAQRLQRLRNLFDQGLIDSQEYEVKKTEIIKDL